MKRKIIALTTDGATFVLGQVAPEQITEVSGRVVNDIEFRRDGVYGITKGAAEEDHYTIILINPMADNDAVVTMAIRFSKVDRIAFITEMEDKDKPAEVAENMQKVD